MKLVVEEAESDALVAHLREDAILATSRIATVEVPRAAAIANPSEAVQLEVDRLLSSCMLVAITTELLRSARSLASHSVRTLDAIHLASALRIAPDELIAYDRRMLRAAADQGLPVVAPTPDAEA